MPENYTLDQIKGALWAVFNHAGEVWFNAQVTNYKGEYVKKSYTHNWWVDFVDALTGQEGESDANNQA